MKTPKHKANAGIHSFSWPEQYLAARVDRISEDSRHAVTGEVTFATTVPGFPSHLHQARLNLTSTTARGTLARYLERFELPDVLWHEVVEFISVLVLETHRQGEPAVQLSDIPETERILFRIKPLLYEGHPNVFYGEGGIGKSLIAAYMAVLMDVNIPAGTKEANGFEAEPGRVLYLDYEASPEDVRDVVAGFHKGLDVQADSTILYRYCYQPVADDIAEIQRIVLEEGIDLLIIDSAGPACGGEPEKASETMRYFSALRSLRITTLTIAHVSKEGGKGGPFGSVYWTNLPRAVFELKKSQEPDSDSLYVGIFHRKVNRGTMMAPRGLEFSFSDKTISVKKVEVADVEVLASNMLLAPRIENALLRGKMTTEELADSLGAPTPGVKAALYRGRGTGKFKSSTGEDGTLYWNIPY